MNPQECPICMDAIDMAKNCSTTECGHCFHTSCLVRNVKMNGISCPCCRTAMAIDEKQDKLNTTHELMNDSFVTVRNRRYRHRREHILVEVPFIDLQDENHSF